jgi:hypothetical protein
LSLARAKSGGRVVVSLPAEFVETRLPVLVVAGDLLLQEPLRNLVRRLVGDDSEQGQARLGELLRIVETCGSGVVPYATVEALARSSSWLASSTA